MKRITRKQAEGAYLDLFYPIHYMVAIRIEDSLRQNQLSRHQTCILWMIRMQGPDVKFVRRKDIEKRLTGWFEISGSTVSKALQALSRNMGLIRISEDPKSGREKLVSLTPKGEQLLHDMAVDGHELMRSMIAELDDDEVSWGVHFLSRVTEIFERLPGNGNGKLAKPLNPAASRADAAN